MKWVQLTRTLLRKFVTFVQSYGEPHEESIVVPVMFTVAAARLSDIGKLSEKNFAIYTIISFVLSGFFLGVALKNDNVVRIMLRTIYIGVLVTIGYYLVTTKTYTEQIYIEFLVYNVLFYGISYYFGWMFGSLIRQIALQTDEQIVRAKNNRRVALNLFRSMFGKAKLPLDPGPFVGNQNENCLEKREESSFRLKPQTVFYFKLQFFRPRISDLKTRRNLLRHVASGTISNFASRLLLLILGFVVYKYADHIPGLIKEVFNFGR